MRTSQTWNQGFEELRFDSQHGHLVAQEHPSPLPNKLFIFDSQELPIARTLINRTLHSLPPNYTINLPPDSATDHRHERQEYSQTEVGHSISDLRRGEESQLEDKGMCILQNSNPHLSSESRGRSPPPKLPASPSQYASHPSPVQGQMSPGQISPVQLGGLPPMMRPAHYPAPAPPLNAPQQPRAGGYNQLQMLTLTPNQSCAPSQKTIVIKHSPQLVPGSPVHRSHVATEKQGPGSERQQRLQLTGPSPKMNFEGVGQANFEGMGQGGKDIMNYPQLPPAHYSERNNSSSDGQWRNKHEQQRHQLEAIRARDRTEMEAAFHRMRFLEQENHALRQNCDQLAEQLRRKAEEIRGLKGSPGGDRKGVDGQLRRQLEERGMLIILLKKENEQVKGKVEQGKGEVEHLNQGLRQYEAENQELHEGLLLVQLELKQREQQVSELRRMQGKQNDYSIISRSRAPSLQNARVVDLQMQTGRLKAEIGARDEAHEHENRLSALKFNELAERFQSSATNKDQTIRTLQEKASLLESDLNKKDSLLRNLRDELVEAERKKGPTGLSHIHHASPKHSITSASGINAPAERIERAEKEESKWEIDNLRKHLFDKERELTIQSQRQEELKEILSETENTATRRKNEMQGLRRQVADCEDQLAELEMYRETLAKKNEELAQIREILIEKEYSGEYESLSKENEKLREISQKKTNEISDLTERLLDSEKKLREQGGFNPRIEALEEEVDMLSSHIRGQQSEIEHLTVTLEHAHQKVLEAELQVEKERERQNELENRLNEEQNQVDELEEGMELAGQRVRLLERQLESLASNMVHQEQENQQLRRTELMFRSQLSANQKELASQATQIEAISREHHELKLFKQRSSQQTQMAEQLQQKDEQLQQKDEQLQLTSARMKDLELQSRVQKEKVVRMEAEVELLRLKQAKHLSCDKTINLLANKVAAYESKILGSVHARQLFHSMSGPPTKVFENQLIYHLKRENENLKNLLMRVGCPNGVSIASLPESDNHRLNLPSQLPSHFREPNSLRRVRSQQTLLSNQLSNQHSRQYLDSLQQQKESRKKTPTLSVALLEQSYNEKVEYYQSQNLSLEERNGTLLRLNRQLKETLSKLSGSKDRELKLFYEEQLSREREKMGRVERQLECARREGRRSEQQLRQAKCRSRRLESPESVSSGFRPKETLSLHS